MVALAVLAAVIVPAGLLIAGLLLLGMAMPAAGHTLARRGWVAPGALALILPASVVLVFLVAWRGDSERSAWSDGGADVRALWVGALALAAAAAALQLWVMMRYEDGVASRVRSVAAGAGGAAMLVLFAALVTAWLTGIE